jgi:hypothetical protein
MANEVEILAPWMPHAEDVIDHVNRLPIWQRRPEADKIGQRFRLTNAERERLRLWTMAPIDMTADDLAEQRKAKERARKARYRRRKGSKSGCIPSPMPMGSRRGL